MAYIVSTTQTATAAAASYTVTLGAHQSGDLLLVKLSQDGGGTAIAPDATATTAGWAMIGTQAASGGSRSAWAFLIADSASEVNPTFTGANDDWIGTCVVVRDAHATAPFGSLVSGTDFVRSDWNNVSSAASGAVTTAVDECLILYSWNSDGNLQYPICKLSELTCLDKYSNTQIAHIIGYRQQQAAGAAPTATMYSQLANEGGNGWVLAIRNKTGGVLQPDIRPDVTQLKWHGSWETTQDSITWEAPSAFAASIGGITCSSVAPTAAYTTNAQQTPWGNYTALPSTENTASLLVGGSFSISSTDMTGKVFALQYALGLASVNAIAGSEGLLIGFSDGTNWVVYQAVSKARGWLSNEDATAFIALGNATEYDSSGSINWGAVTRMAYLLHRAGSSASSINLFAKHAALFGKTALTGGGEARPATFNDYQSAMNSWGNWRWTDIQGAAQIKPKTSVQLGDGTNTTYFDGATGQFGFPQAWSASSVANWQMDWNVNSGQVGLFIKAGASDTIKLAAGAATSGNAQLLTIDAASSASATYDFAQAFGGFVPTLKTGITETGTTFTGCGKVDAKGSSLTNCVVKNTTATDAAIAWTENGATVTGTTITVSATTAYHMETGASVTAITLADVTFSGTPGTDKVHVLATTNTVTITISGSTALVAGDVTSAGATVVIAAPTPTLDATVLAGSRVVLYNNTTDAELDNTAPAGTSWSKQITSGASSGDSLTLHVFKLGYEEFQTTFLYTGVDSTPLVTQVVDAVESSLATELGYDGSSVTEYALDITGTVEVDADDVDGLSLKARVVLWYKYILTTENGARYLRGAYSLLSTAAFRQNVDVIDLKIANIGVTQGLQFTDTERRLYRSDGTPIWATASAPGSIQNDYSGVPDTVETGVSGLTGSESAQLMGLTNAPSAATVAAAVLSEAASTPIAANIKQVNSLAVDGSGTESDPWGPV